MVARTAFSAGAGVISSGKEFETSESRAKQLEERGLARRVKQNKTAEPERTQNVEAEPFEESRPTRKRKTKSADKNDS